MFWSLYFIRTWHHVWYLHFPSLFKIIRDQNAFFLIKKKNSICFFDDWNLVWKTFEFSIKIFISLLLNTSMIYGFYSLGGEIYFKSELMVNFLSRCEIWLVYLWSCSLRYGFLSYWISLKEHWERFEKDPSLICDYKIF